MDYDDRRRGHIVCVIFIFCSAHHVKESFCVMSSYTHGQEKQFHKPEMIRVMGKRDGVYIKHML